MHLLHLDTPKAAALPVGCARLYGAIPVEPHDIAAAVLPVHELPDDREAALRPACRADAAGKVQVLALKDDAGIAGHLHGDGALWEEGESAALGLSGLYCTLPTDAKGGWVPMSPYSGTESLGGGKRSDAAARPWMVLSTVA